MNRNTMKIATLTACVLAPLTAVAQPSGHDDHAGHVHYINGPRVDAPIPRPGVDLSRGNFAVVVIDPQNDFLSPEALPGVSSARA